MLKIGHRGAKGYLTENTIPSILKAIEIQVDGIEVDVHRTVCGELVVFHDFTLDQLTNGSGEVKTFTLEELQKLTVIDGYRIPKLSEVLDIISGTDLLLNIELKGLHTAKPVCRILKDIISQGKLSESQILISSFQKHELEFVAETYPELKIGILTKASVTEAIEFADKINAYAIHPNMSLLSKNNVKKAKDLGYKVYTWTVNDVDTIDRAKSYGVDGIISDFPDRL